MIFLHLKDRDGRLCDFCTINHRADISNLLSTENLLHNDNSLPQRVVSERQYARCAETNFFL